MTQATANSGHPATNSVGQCLEFTMSLRHMDVVSQRQNKTRERRCRSLVRRPVPIGGYAASLAVKPFVSTVAACSGRANPYTIAANTITAPANAANDV